MRNFKRKVKHQLNNEIQSFDQWYQGNEQSVQEAVPTTHRQDNGVVKLKRITRWAVACACVLLVLCISLPFVLKSPEEAPTYGSSDVGGVLIEDEKSYQYLRGMGLNFNLEYLNGREMYTRETKELVMAFVSGDYEIEGGDYYLLEFIYHLDDRYHFGDKSIYESLTDKVAVGDYTIYYREGNASTLFVNYLLKIEYKGNVCYADVECFEHSFDDLVALLTGTLS